MSDSLNLATGTTSSLAVPTRLYGLDLIRAIAILWVMVYHAANMDLIPDPDHLLVQFGWMGVDLFFVLSGYLIASQLLKPFAEGKQPDYLKFCYRRLMRTIPAYAVVVAIYFSFPSFREQKDIQPLWQFVTFTENLLFDIQTPKAFSHVWSLCVEEQFYLALPLTIALLGRKRLGKHGAKILLALFLGGVGVRAFLWLAYVSDVPLSIAGEPDPRPYTTLIYYPTWSRLDGLLAGIALAAVKLFRPELWGQLTSRPNLLIVLGLAGITASIWWFGSQIPTFLPAVFGFPLLSVSITLLVAGGAQDEAVISRFRIPGVSALASTAYSFYLSHKLAFHLTSVSGMQPGWLQFSTAMAVALFVGSSLYWSIERPFLKLRDRHAISFNFSVRPA